MQAWVDAAEQSGLHGCLVQQLRVYCCWALVDAVSPCSGFHAVLFLHPICINIYTLRRKRTALQLTGFWFMDTDANGNCAQQPGSASRVPACKPVQWRVPGTEAPHYACPSPGLALVHGGEAQALAALAAGALQYGGGNKSAEDALVRSFQPIC